MIVDGGSSDGTMSVVEKYDAHIDRYVSEPDQGIFDAMNKGIGMATGDVIAFLNSDDWYEEGALDRVMQVLMDSDCDCVYCDNHVLGKDGQKRYFDASRYTAEDLHVQMICYHSAIFCRKGYFKKDGNFDLSYKIAADYDWFLRIVERGAKLQYIHHPVFTFCHGGMSSTNEIKCAMEARAIALRHLPADGRIYRDRIDRKLCEAVLYTLDKKVLYPKLTELFGKEHRHILWGAGARGTLCAELLLGAGVTVDAVVDSDSSLWGSFLSGIPVCSPKILEEEDCDLIITPEKCVDEIKAALNGSSNVHVFELNGLCRVLAGSVL